MKNNFVVSNRGITLIALIITIIVLLILAGVTLNSIFGNQNAMDKALEAKMETEKSEINEALSVAVMMIRTKALIEVKDKGNYYADKETFKKVGNFEEAVYPIESYNYNNETRKAELNIKKNQGTGTAYTFKIDVNTDTIEGSE